MKGYVETNKEHWEVTDLELIESIVKEKHYSLGVAVREALDERKELKEEIIVVDGLQEKINELEHKIENSNFEQLKYEVVQIASVVHGANGKKPNKEDLQIALYKILKLIAEKD